jgi:hypothetical protein
MGKQNKNASRGLHVTAEESKKRRGRKKKDDPIYMPDHMDQAKDTIERIEALSRGGRKLTPKEVEERLQNYSVMRRNELVLKD